ncbi:MAG TPA: Stf0 family sulfotransferase [Lacipirellulaceae bacterium]
MARPFEPRRLRRAQPVAGQSARPVEPDTAFAVIACQRNGTHLLRHILNSNSEIAVLGETFSHAEYFMCWHNFVQTLPDGYYPPRTQSDTMMLVDHYLHAIRRDVHANSDCYGGPKSRLKLIGLDIKYEHIRCVAPLYSNLRSRPFLFDYFRDRLVRIVHLVRRNVVQTAISVIIANTRKVWHNYDGGRIDGRYRIAPDALFRYIEWIQGEREEFLRLSQDLCMQTCLYEDLVDDMARVDGAGFFREDSTLSSIATFLNVANRFQYVPGMSKVINRPYCEILANYDALRRAIEDSAYSEFAGTL